MVMTTFSLHSGDIEGSRHQLAQGLEPFFDFWVWQAEVKPLGSNSTTRNLLHSMRDDLK